MKEKNKQVDFIFINVWIASIHFISKESEIIELQKKKIESQYTLERSYI